MRRLLRGRAPVVIVLMFAMVATSGCAAGMKNMIEQQNASLLEMQTQVNEFVQQEDARAQEFDALRRDISQIGSKVTETEDTISELSRKTENVSTRLSLLNDEITRLKTEPATPPAAESVVLFGERPAMAAGNTRAIYDNALRLYYDENPREAIEEWTRARDSDPTGDLADNADYWIGECYYKLEEFDPALAAFQRVFSHPASNKVEDAQLKIGMTYRLMGRRTEAITALQKLIDTYPTSQHVGLARQIIAEIGG